MALTKHKHKNFNTPKVDKTIINNQKKSYKKL